MTISLTAARFGQDIKYGLMSGFCLDLKEQADMKIHPVVRFGLQQSNFDLPKIVNTEVAFLKDSVFLWLLVLDMHLSERLPRRGST